MQALRKMTFAAVALFVLVAARGAAQADPVTLTFGELTPRTANGVSIAGVTFGFTLNGVPSRDAVYNQLSPGPLVFLQGPALVGNAAGQLTLNFARPVDLLKFDVALSLISPLTQGFGVQLYDVNLQPFSFLIVSTAPILTFSEGEFRFSGALVSRAVIVFNSGVSRFALDNLTFNPVPEPASLVLLGAGLGLITLRRVWGRRSSLES